MEPNLELIEKLVKNKIPNGFLGRKITQEVKKELARLSELEFMNDFDRDKCFHLVDRLCQKRLEVINKYVTSGKDEDDKVFFEFKEIKNEAGFTNDYVVEVKENSIKIIGRKIRGSMCHPHIDANGSACFGVSHSEVLDVFNKDVVAFVELMYNFLGQCNHTGAIGSWREASAVEAM
jgi:hypothetical protein